MYLVDVVSADAVCDKLQFVFCDSAARQTQAQHASLSASLGIAAEAAGKAFVFGNRNLAVIKIAGYFFKLFVIFFPVLNIHIFLLFMLH